MAQVPDKFVRGSVGPGRDRNHEGDQENLRKGSILLRSIYMSTISTLPEKALERRSLQRAT
jgi:hypothetical protein